MTAADRPDANAPAPEPKGLSCEGARELLPRHAKSALNQGEQARFRAHILRCNECRDAYRSAISLTARVGRAVGDSRLERARKERRMQGSGRTFHVGSFGRTRAGYWLRGVLGTALLITLVTRLPGWASTPTLDATWQAGSVTAGTKELSQGDKVGELVTGDWVVTQPNGAARVRGGGGTLALFAGTAVLVEDPRGCRVRFQRGTLEAEGRAFLATQYGFIELDGGAVRLTKTIEGLQLEVLDGTAAWTHPLGTERLDAGTSGLVSRPGPVVAAR